MPAITGLSVELDWTEDPKTIDGIMQIKKYSIVRVAFLVSDKPGQQQSRINFNNYNIKKLRMNEELQKLQANIDLFETGNFDKLRDGELSDQYLVYTDLKKRICEACQIEAKRTADALAEENKTKMRSEQDVLDKIDALSIMVQALTAKMDDMTKKESVNNMKDKNIDIMSTDPAKTRMVGFDKKTQEEEFDASKY